MGFSYDEKREFEIQGLVDKAQQIISEYSDFIDIDELMQILGDLDMANKSGNMEETNNLAVSLEDVIDEIESSIDNN